MDAGHDVHYYKSCACSSFISCFHPGLFLKLNILEMHHRKRRQVNKVSAQLNMTQLEAKQECTVVQSAR